MSIAERPRHALRFRGRSFLALALAPEPPLADWMADLDAWSDKSPGFFVSRPVVLDLSALPIDRDGVAALVADLYRRDIRIMGVEGVDANWLGLGLPPPLTGGRPAGPLETIDAQRARREAARTVVAPEPAEAAPSAAAPEPPARAPEGPHSLLLREPVRSGQTIMFPEGDVTVVGSVASGAEIVAGGSIHVYGALRGRAIAGVTGNPRAQIFCRRFEAELLAIDGLYKTADSLESSLRLRPIQAWVDGDAIQITTLD
ncbi:septum site-determining protein MinC [Alsobacter sp. SYSU M60028]|uniref:Probable septum site-determining protein MinC n=1 Tax=Alsobacter ponti TaxID=2962936 RepID=A0ABT1LJ28_9HYPH|nr:septum site-determining protein MinC [Alsobacter ponti]